MLLFKTDSMSIHSSRAILDKMKLLVCAVVIGMSSACTITPVHKTSFIDRNGGESVSALLQNLEISEPRTRFDQLVRNELLFRINTRSKQDTNNNLYLDLNTHKLRRSIGISDIDVGPRAFFISIESSYILKSQQAAAPIAQGVQTGTASYDRVIQEFSNTRAERDAEKRAAKQSASKIYNALILALKENQINGN